MTFDLRAVVDRALDTSDEPDPRQVARNALLRIPVEHREQALLTALECYVEARLYERQDEVPL